MAHRERQGKTAKIQTRPAGGKAAMAATLISSKPAAPATANAPTRESRRIASRRSRSKPPNRASQQSINPSRCRARVRIINATVIMAANSSGGKGWYSWAKSG